MRFWHNQDSSEIRCFKMQNATFRREGETFVLRKVRCLLVVFAVEFPNTLVVVPAWYLPKAALIPCLEAHMIYLWQEGESYDENNRPKMNARGTVTTLTFRISFCKRQGDGRGLERDWGCSSSTRDRTRLNYFSLTQRFSITPLADASMRD